MKIKILFLNLNNRNGAVRKRELELKLKKNWSCVLLLILPFLLISLRSFGRTKQAIISSDIISVKDFGAKGDGKTDDTKAIQAAINAAESTTISTQQILSGVNTEVFFGGEEEIYFPFGFYRISGTLNFGSYLNIHADKAVLLPTAGLLSSITALKGIGWQIQIKGLQFVGFQNALEINNHDMNTGRVIISDCDFLNNNVAITLSAQSSITTISECRFVNNQKVLIQNACDKSIFKDSWISAGRMQGAHDAQIIVRAGTMHFDNNLLVPVIPSNDAVEPAWINNYGSVWVSGIRQGAEPGSFTLINNFSKADKSFLNAPSVVSVQNSTCYAVYGNTSNYLEPAVVRLFNLPNQIILENLSGLVDAQIIDFSHTDSRARNNIIQHLPTLDNHVCSIYLNNIVGGYSLLSGSFVPDILSRFLVK